MAVSGGVHQVQRVVDHVAVAVVVLAVQGILDNRVGAQHPAQGGVVDPPVHVDQADGVEMFVAGEATIQGRGGDWSTLPGDGVAALAEGVVAEPFYVQATAGEISNRGD